MAWAAFRMRVSQAFGVFWENQLSFVLIGWRLISGTFVLLWSLTETWRIFYANLLGVPPDSVGSGCWCFRASATHHLSQESEKTWLFCLQPFGYDPCGLFGKDCQKPKPLRFLVKGGHSCREWLWQLRNSVDVVETGGCPFARQLLKSQQNLVWFNCRWGILAAEF